MPADGPYAGYLLDALAATGEPLNHVQSAYFGHLARAMTADGVPAGLCGEGADSLFGLGLANQLHNAGAAAPPAARAGRCGGWPAPLAGLARLRRGCAARSGWPTASTTSRTSNIR